MSTDRLGIDSDDQAIVDDLVADRMSEAEASPVSKQEPSRSYGEILAENEQLRRQIVDATEAMTWLAEKLRIYAGYSIRGWIRRAYEAIEQERGDR